MVVILVGDNECIKKSIAEELCKSFGFKYFIDDSFKEKNEEKSEKENRVKFDTFLNLLEKEIIVDRVVTNMNHLSLCVGSYENREAALKFDKRLTNVCDVFMVCARNSERTDSYTLSIDQLFLMSGIRKKITVCSDCYMQAVNLIGGCL